HRGHPLHHLGVHAQGPGHLLTEGERRAHREDPAFRHQTGLRPVWRSRFPKFDGGWATPCSFGGSMVSHTDPWVFASMTFWASPGDRAKVIRVACEPLPLPRAAPVEGTSTLRIWTSGTTVTVM